MAVRRRIPMSGKRHVARVRGASRAGGSSREEQFLRLWELVDRELEVVDREFAAKHPPQREWRFDGERMWRFDFAWPALRVAVEIEGGTYGHGPSRHTSAVGHQADCDKYNAAAIAGWCVLKYTSVDLQKRPLQIMQEIRWVLQKRQAAGAGLHEFPVDTRKWE